MDLIDVGPEDPRLPEVFAVLVQLRTHLDEREFRAIYRSGYDEGLRFLAACDDGRCVAVAGWRIVNGTSTIRKLYIDDLVTDEAFRSSGCGHVLLEELERRAVDAGCTSIELDSGVQRFDAHRFYLRERMDIVAHHFAKSLTR